MEAIMVTKSLALATALSLILSSAALAQTAGTSSEGEGAGTPPATTQTNSMKKRMPPRDSAAPNETNGDSTTSGTPGQVAPDSAGPGDGSAGH